MPVEVVNYNWKVAYCLLCLFSMINSISIPLLYYISKKTRHHPAILLVWICICEMICSFHLLIWACDLIDYMEYFQVNQLIYYWSFGTMFAGVETPMQKYFVECVQNQTVYFIFLYLQFNIYIMLCLDLIITLKKPFISGKQRIKAYSTIIITSTVILQISTTGKIHEYCIRYIDEDEGHAPVLDISFVQVIITELIFYIVGVTSIVLAVQNSRQFQNEARQQYIRSHITLVLVIFILWMVPFVNNLLTMIGHKYAPLNNISFAILLSQGIFIGLVRLQEKYFRLRLKVLFLQIFNLASDDLKMQIKQQEADDLVEQDTWTCSLATLMGRMQNQDLVKTLLSGIVNILDKATADTVLDQDASLPSRDTLTRWVQQVKKETNHYMGELEESSQEILRRLSGKANSLLGIKIKVQEYAPCLFEILRRFDDIKISDIIQSFSVTKNIDQIKRAQESMGKSGSFFFFSFDKKFILKTMTETEVNILHKSFLDQYSIYIMQNKQSFIARIYGAFTVNIDGVTPIHLILMENSLRGADFKILYDLKGSLINRISDVHDMVKKDVNFIRSEDIFLELKQSIRDTIVEQLRKDSDFLFSLKIMDYSLLLGIAKGSVPQGSLRLINEERDRVLSLAVIDYFQTFDTYKYLEYKYKTLIKQKEESLISCVFPRQYLLRFQQFMNQLFISVIDYK